MIKENQKKDSTKKKVSRIPKKKEKIVEVFDVKENGKKKTIKKEAIIETPVENPGQKKHQAKVLAWVLGSCIVILALIIGIYLHVESLKHLDYNGVEFKMISEGDIIAYQTSIPVMYKGKQVDYNFYLRTKPSQLEKIKFDREDFNLMKFSVINLEDEFKCNDGDEIIAIANLNLLHNVLGIQTMSDKNATCDTEGRYTLYNLIKADKTEIEKIGKNCYNVKIADCEILPATEKIMAEMLYKLKNE